MPLQVGNKLSGNENGEPVRLPVFICWSRLGSAAKITRVFLGDAHRKSGVISVCFALSPVESCSPPELCELTSSGVRLCYCRRKGRVGKD